MSPAWTRTPIPPGERVRTRKAPLPASRPGPGRWLSPPPRLAGSRAEASGPPRACCRDGSGRLATETRSGRVCCGDRVGLALLYGPGRAGSAAGFCPASSADSTPCAACPSLLREKPWPPALHFLPSPLSRASARAPVRRPPPSIQGWPEMQVLPACSRRLDSARAVLQDWHPGSRQSSCLLLPPEASRGQRGLRGTCRSGGCVVLEACAWVLGAGSEQGYRRTLAASHQADGQRSLSPSGPGRWRRAGRLCGVGAEASAGHKRWPGVRGPASLPPAGSPWKQKGFS